MPTRNPVAVPKREFAPSSSPHSSRSLSPAAALAQKPMCHAMGTRDEVLARQTSRSRKNLTGIGNVHLKITATPEVQTWFDQGLNLYHDFWDYESARAFQQAIRIDPNCAMCYWGLYLAQSMRNSEDPYAIEALKKAVALKNHAAQKRTPLHRSRRCRRKRTSGSKQEIQRRRRIRRSQNSSQARQALASRHARAHASRLGAAEMATTMTANRKKARKKRSRFCRPF